MPVVSCWALRREGAGDLVERTPQWDWGEQGQGMLAGRAAWLLQWLSAREGWEITWHKKREGYKRQRRLAVAASFWLLIKTCFLDS
jgi:hypothetical protein